MSDRRTPDRRAVDRTAPGDGKGEAKVQEKPDSDADPQVQAIVDVETEQGFRGVEVDKTPNEAYSLAGQNAGAPTPETDEATKKAAAEGQAEVAKQANGVGER